MPGPATLFSTIGAVGAAASAAVYVTKAISFPDVQQQASSKSNDNAIKASSYSSLSGNKKLRFSHRNDIHVLMFVVGKD
ncbi:hypothetical protein V8B55DRAFT_1570238 [Mucor lusitanicus]|uniref:Uncharacterized protein n=2 Tax=Mucor circinelloides f. lusitanicus TaxID=29924 RepID=A0A162QQZ4_MUCCL|nr:hypothetical protein FB192DRAFT_1354548 [Mucor lusitanicus]OAD01499.1 hypothetical protein MUCCIDRAFT_112949 [Mucor lusitanicus CBS 277.49]